MRAPFQLRSLLLGSAGSLLIWSVLGFASAAQLVFNGSFAWTEALRITVRDWLPWALLSPLVLALALQFPLERGRWPVSLAVHCVACALALFACEWLRHFLEPAGLPTPRELAQRRPFAGPRPEDPPPWARPDAPERHGPPRPERRDLRRLLPGGGMTPRTWFNLPIYWGVVSVAHTLLFYRRSQERERKALELTAGLARAKLQALRMQLQPHFLFNTLNAISTLVHRDARAADEMIGNLADFLRLTLETADQQEVPLQQELDFLDRYLAIEQVRFGDRLRVEKEIPADTLAAQVPAMILQPLVENSVRHGLEPSRTPGVLRIVARRAGATLHLAIHDNGVGISSARENREGIGLSNTRARLRELYGDRATLELRNGAESGLVVEITLPFCDQPRPSAIAPA